MENREIAIRLSGVKKMYKLGQIGGGTLTADLQSWWARVRGKEDPNTKIGTDQRLVGQTFMALNGIDLTVYQGEALGIIGGNGAGKSTMLKLLSRVTAPTAGKIWLNGRVASMLEVGTGFNGEMTGRENIYMNGAILGMTRAEIDAKMEDIIEFSEVREFIDTPVKRYSSGMYVKLAFSVAAHLDSEIMIMDEVLAVGDMAFQKKCLNKMRDAAKKEGRTVLYVSHNMNTIRQLCDRCIVLDKGKVVFEGDVEEAIGVYLKKERSNALSYDFTNIKRDGRKSYKVQLLGLDILAEENNFCRGDDLWVCLHCKANANHSNIKFRFEIFYSDSSVVGSALSNKGITVQEGQLFDVHMALGTKNLAPGQYYAIVLAYEDDENGHQIDTDRVEPAFFFEVVTPENHSLLWLHKYWGHVQFDDINVENMSVL